MHTALHKKGQGLLEAVIALGVIMTGVIAALTLAIGNLSVGGVAATRIAAANLAREGVEVVRNVRDTNWVLGRAWDEGLSEGSYALDWEPTERRLVLRPLLGTLTPETLRVYRDAANGIFTMGGGASTPFMRSVTLSFLCPEAQVTCARDTRIGVRVASNVGWEERGVTPRNPQMQVIAELYAWR